MSNNKINTGFSNNSLLTTKNSNNTYTQAQTTIKEKINDIEEMDFSIESNKLDSMTVANQVLNGEWGNGEDRKIRLREAGYNPEEIQSLVNGILNGTVSNTVDNSKLQEIEKKQPEQKIVVETEIKPAAENLVTNNIKQTEEKIDPPKKEQTIKSSTEKNSNAEKKVNKFFSNFKSLISTKTKNTILTIENKLNETKKAFSKFRIKVKKTIKSLFKKNEKTEEIKTYTFNNGKEIKYDNIKEGCYMLGDKIVLQKNADGSILDVETGTVWFEDGSYFIGEYNVCTKMDSNEVSRIDAIGTKYNKDNVVIEKYLYVNNYRYNAHKIIYNNDGTIDCYNKDGEFMGTYDKNGNIIKTETLIGVLDISNNKNIKDYKNVQFDRENNCYRINESIDGNCDYYTISLSGEYRYYNNDGNSYSLNYYKKSSATDGLVGCTLDDYYSNSELIDRGIDYKAITYYDKFGNNTGETIYNTSDNSIKEKETREYDDNGKLIKETFHNSNTNTVKNFNAIKKYEYNSDGKISKIITEEETGKYNSVMKYHYNEDGSYYTAENKNITYYKGEEKLEKFKKDYTSIGDGGNIQALEVTKYDVNGKCTELMIYDYDKKSLTYGTSNNLWEIMTFNPKKYY